MKLLCLSILIFSAYAAQGGSAAPAKTEMRELQLLRDILREEIAKRQDMLLRDGPSGTGASGNGQGQQQQQGGGTTGTGADVSGQGQQQQQGDGTSGPDADGPSGLSGNGPSGDGSGDISKGGDKKDNPKPSGDPSKRGGGGHQHGGSKGGDKKGHGKPSKNHSGDHSGHSGDHSGHSGDTSGDGGASGQAAKASEQAGHEQARQLLVDLETSVRNVFDQQVNEALALIDQEDVKGARAILDNIMIVLDELPRETHDIIEEFRDEFKPLAAAIEAVEEALKQAAEAGQAGNQQPTKRGRGNSRKNKLRAESMDQVVIPHAQLVESRLFEIAAKGDHDFDDFLERTRASS